MCTVYIYIYYIYYIYIFIIYVYISMIYVNVHTFDLLYILHLKSNVFLMHIYMIGKGNNMRFLTSHLLFT